MQRSSHDLRGGWNDGQVGHSQDEDPLDVLDLVPSSFASSLPTPNISHEMHPDTSLPTVDQFAVGAFESTPGDSTSSASTYPAFYGPATLFSSSTLHNPSMPNHGSTTNSGAMTFPLQSPATHSIYPSLMDLSASIFSSQVPTYRADPPLSPHDGTLPTSADALLSHVIAALAGPSDQVAACLPSSYPVINDGPQPSENAEVPPAIVYPTPSMKSNLLARRKKKSKSRKPPLNTQSHDPPPTSSRFRARLFEGASISYGGGLRLDLVGVPGGDGLLADYDELAFPSQTFSQKVSFWLQCGGYLPCTRQHHVLSRGRQPTKHRLAEVTVRFVEYFIKDCEERGQLFRFSLENLVLRRIDVVSRSAIRPVLDFVVPAG